MSSATPQGSAWRHHCLGRTRSRTCDQTMSLKAGRLSDCPQAGSGSSRWDAWPHDQDTSKAVSAGIPSCGKFERPQQGKTRRPLTPAHAGQGWVASLLLEERQGPPADRYGVPAPGLSLDVPVEHPLEADIGCSTFKNVTSTCYRRVLQIPPIHRAAETRWLITRDLWKKLTSLTPGTGSTVRAAWFPT
jgi:hypothetical protein